MSLCKNRFLNKTSDTSTLALWLGLGVGVGAFGTLLFNRWRERQQDHPYGLEEAERVPHTDYASAAAIGRKTGGEVFDD